MTITLYFSDTSSLSSVMMSHYSGDFNVSLSEPVLADLFSDFPVVADAAARCAARSFHLSAVPVVAGVAYLDAVQLRRTALVRRT
jgi:hypothetical protein